MKSPAATTSGGTRQVVIGKFTSTADIIAQLAARRCPDITKELDLSQTQESPTSRGGFGDVYRGKLRDGREVAIKCLRVYLDSSDGRQVRKAAAHELYTWSKAKHPNVLELLGVARFQNQLAMVSPWMGNNKTSVYLTKNPTADRCKLCVQIVEGLLYLHSQNIVHGDIKGDNVMMSGDGTAMLVDFGSARLLEYTLQFTDAAEPNSGTMRFLAPEILLGQSGSSVEADIYALGMVDLQTIFNIISGEIPFKGIDHHAVTYTVTRMKSVPTRPERTIPSSSDHGDTLWSLLLRCWSQDPTVRPTAPEVRDMMRNITQAGLRSMNAEPSIQDLFDSEEELSTTRDAVDITHRLDLSSCSALPFFTGNTSEIYCGRLDDGTDVAIKRVMNSSETNHAAWEMYVWSKTKHNHVLPLLGAAEFLGQFSLISPYLKNRDLRSYLFSNPEVDRYSLCTQIGEGLAYLHSNGIVHGNITVDNILISEEGTVKLADLGKAVLTECSIVITSTSTPGSDEAPELLEGRAETRNFKTDIYALGKTIYRVMTANNIYQPPLLIDQLGVTDIDPTIESTTLLSKQPVWNEHHHNQMLRTLLKKCWDVDPVNRPDAAETHETLKTIAHMQRTHQSVITSKNSAWDIVLILAGHGCPDLTSNLDLSSRSSHPINSGGFGDVYTGHLLDGHRVAIKCVRQLSGLSVQENAKDLKRAARELYTWSKMRHRNILELLGLVCFQNQVAILSPWMSNGDLRSYLRNHPETADRHRLCIQIADGLMYMHTISVVHGDLKGANVLISDTGHAQITDFGNSILGDQSLRFTQTTSSTQMTMRWAAPELLTGDGKPSMEADVYSLGMTILEAITGEIPFHGLSELHVLMNVTLKGEIPARPDECIQSNNRNGDVLWALLKQCWSKDPQARPVAPGVWRELSNMSNNSP